MFCLRWDFERQSSVLGMELSGRRRGEWTLRVSSCWEGDGAEAARGAPVLVSL